MTAKKTKKNSSGSLGELNLHSAYTAQQIAGILDLSPKTVGKLIKNGKIIAKRVGHKYIITGYAVYDFLGVTNLVRH